jgi:hypothetical protein
VARLGDLREQRPWSAGASSPGPVVHHQQVVADREHRFPAAPAGSEVVVQQGVLAPAGLLEQGLLDAPGKRRRGHHHHHSCVAPPARQVDHTEHLAGDWVPDRHPGTGQVLQVLHVVLVAEDAGRPAALQRRADAVGADVLLGVAEAGGEPDPVQAFLQALVAGVTGEDDAVGVAEDDADLLVNCSAASRQRGDLQSGLAVRSASSVGGRPGRAEPGPGPDQDRLPATSGDGSPSVSDAGSANRAARHPGFRTA